MWVRAGKGTPDQLERYHAYIAAYELQTVDPPAQHTLFNQADPQPVTSRPEDTQPVGYPATVKLWPMVGLAAVQTLHGGAWRAWALCHALDRDGSGRCLRSDLWGWLHELDVDERTRRRWLRDALDLSLITEAGDHYYLVGLGRAAVMLGCDDIGTPAEISPGALVREGWRSVVWGAYIATLNGRPISQETKHRITGVDPRTQRNYQAQVPGAVRRNYAKTNTPGSHITGVRDNGRPGSFVGRDGRIVYRLPDIRTIPGNVARLTPRGRSRKAQKQVKLLCIVAREKGQLLRLFHDTAKGVKATLRAILRADLPPSDTPGEIYQLIRAGISVNLWQPVPVGEVLP